MPNAEQEWKQAKRWGFGPGGAVVKNWPANARVAEDTGSIPGLGRSLGEGNGNPLQYSCLENSMDRGARWAIVHVVAESDPTEHACTLSLSYRLQREQISMGAEQKRVVIFSKHDVLWILRRELENRLLVAWKQIKGISFQQQEPFRGNQSDRGVILKIKARRSITEGAGWEDR